MYLFDDRKLQNGELEVVNSIPYSDETDLPADQKAEFEASGEPFAFGHSLDDLLGGIIAAGLVIDRFFEDGFGRGAYACLDRHIKAFMAIRATRPGG